MSTAPPPHPLLTTPTTNKHHMQTVGQIMMNCDKKEITIRLDKKYGELTGIENLLPKGYEPKIKLKHKQ